MSSTIARPKTAFFIFFDEFAQLHRAEYNRYHLCADAASKAWHNLDTHTKQNYYKLSMLQLKAYKIQKN